MDKQKILDFIQYRMSLIGGSENYREGIRNELSEVFRFIEGEGKCKTCGGRGFYVVDYTTHDIYEDCPDCSGETDNVFTDSCCHCRSWDICKAKDSLLATFFVLKSELAIREVYQHYAENCKFYERMEK